MESKQFGDIKVHRVKEEGISLDGSMDLIEVSFEPQGSSRKTSPTSLTTKKFSKYLRYITSDNIVLIYAVFKENDISKYNSMYVITRTDKNLGAP